MGKGVGLKIKMFNKRLSIMGRVKQTVLVFLIPVIFSCSATRINTYSIDGKETVCNRDTRLGSVVVLPEVAWRKDQKEPRKREAMALVEIKKAFEEISCGRVSSSDGVKGFSGWSLIPEEKIMHRFSDEGFDTIIFIRIEELTPRLNVTFSIPFLWSGANEADFRIRVVTTKTGEVLNDMRIQRVTGGLFHIRPAEWSGDELYLALRAII